MHVCHVIVHREDIFEILLVWEDVNHPGEHIGVEVAACGVAGLLRSNRAEHAELRMRSKILVGLVCRSRAEIGVLVPAGDAGRNALIELLHACMHAGRVHHALQLELLVRSVAIEKGGGLGRSKVVSAARELASFSK